MCGRADPRVEPEDDVRGMVFTIAGLILMPMGPGLARPSFCRGTLRAREADSRVEP